MKQIDKDIITKEFRGTPELALEIYEDIKREGFSDNIEEIFDKEIERTFGALFGMTELIFPLKLAANEGTYES